MIQIQTATPDKLQALRIADTVIRENLAACAQVHGPITSTFRWKGEVDTKEEWLCTIKTRTELYEKVEEAILEIHSYETPEIIATPVVRSNGKYLAWVYDETEKNG